MWRRIAVAGATAAVIVGAGGAALATSGTGSTVTGTPSAPGSSDSRPGHPGLRAAGRGVLHGQFVTRSKDDPSTYVTHTVVRGAVTAVSATSISVKAADGFTQAFTVTADTTVHQRGSGRGTTVKIDTVKVGATVVVAGTGTDPVTAKHVLLGVK